MKHIAFCCDDGYAPYLEITLISILENCRDARDLKFWLFGFGVSPESQSLLSDLAGRHGASFQYTEFDPGRIPDSAPTDSHISLAAYFRILLPELLPAEVSRVLYLDCDLILNGQVEEILESSLEGRPLGAVWNPGFVRHAALGIDPDWGYLNSGVMLFDAEKWRSDDLCKAALEVIEVMGDRLLMYDQDALNIALRGNWHRLPIRFNVQTSMFRMDLEMTRIDQARVEEARGNPLVIHFSSALKPWCFEGWHPLRWKYFEYLDKSILSGFRPGPTGLRSLGRYLNWRRRLGLVNRPATAAKS